MQLKTAHITDIMTMNTHVPRTSSFCWLLQGIFSGILQDERSPTCLLSLEKWDKKMQRRGNCVLLPSQTSLPLPPSHQPCEKARTRRLPSSSSRCHSGIRLIQSVGENLPPLLLFTCPSTRLLLSISWSISDSCYIWAERQQFILARLVHI